MPKKFDLKSSVQANAKKNQRAMEGNSFTPAEDLFEKPEEKKTKDRPKAEKAKKAENPPIAEKTEIRPKTEITEITTKTDHTEMTKETTAPVLKGGQDLIIYGIRVRKGYRNKLKVEGTKKGLKYHEYFRMILEDALDDFEEHPVEPEEEDLEPVSHAIGTTTYLPGEDIERLKKDARTMGIPITAFIDRILRQKFD